MTKCQQRTGGRKTGKKIQPKGSQNSSFWLVRNEEGPVYLPFPKTDINKPFSLSRYIVVIPSPRRVVPCRGLRLPVQASTACQAGLSTLSELGSAVNSNSIGWPDKGGAFHCWLCGVTHMRKRAIPGPLLTACVTSLVVPKMMR